MLEILLRCGCVGGNQQTANAHQRRLVENTFPPQTNGKISREESFLAFNYSAISYLFHLYHTFLRLCAADIEAFV